MTGVINTDKTFPYGHSFVLSEPAEAFKFIDIQIDTLTWYDCNGPRVVLGDQAKGLISSIENGVEEWREREKEDVILQLYEYHAAVNMQTRIKKTGKYNEENVRELTNQVWAYIKAPTIEDLDIARDILLRNLQPIC